MSFALQSGLESGFGNLEGASAGCPFCVVVGEEFFTDDEVGDAVVFEGDFNLANRLVEAVFFRIGGGVIGEADDFVFDQALEEGCGLGFAGGAAVLLEEGTAGSLVFTGDGMPAFGSFMWVEGES